MYTVSSVKNIKNIRAFLFFFNVILLRYFLFFVFVYKFNICLIKILNNDHIHYHLEFSSLYILLYFFSHLMSLRMIITPVLIGSFSLKSEWQQVSSGHESILVDLLWSEWSLISNSPTSLFQTLGDCSKGTNYISYHSHVPQLFQLSGKNLSSFSFSFIFTVCSTGTAKSTRSQILFFLFLSIPGLLFWLRSDDNFVSQNLREFNVSFSRTGFSLCIYHLY